MMKSKNAKREGVVGSDWPVFRRPHTIIESLREDELLEVTVVSRFRPVIINMKDEG